jgi:uncharacterized iron-regulated membrane protein
MNTRKLRNLSFFFHRYLGLIIGIFLIIVGITGSLLVFQHEIDNHLILRQFPPLETSTQTVNIDSIIDRLQKTYPDLNLTGISTLSESEGYYSAWLESDDEQHTHTQVFVNSQTGQILGDRLWENSLYGFIYRLHYQLLAGQTGQFIMGIVAFILFILCLTGIVLWPGWRKLIAGFKIKWNARAKRLNFDLHKVVGIITAVFLAMIAISGAGWNFYEQTEKVAHVVTFTSMKSEPVSKPISDRSPLPVSQLLSKADAVFPEAKTTYIAVPQTPEAVLQVSKKQPSESSHYGFSNIYLDRYSGEVVDVENGLKPTRAKAVLNAFVPMHYGTFGGLATRILYVFVGLAPTILFITGLVMYLLRRRPKIVEQTSRELVER